MYLSKKKILSNQKLFKYLLSIYRGESIEKICAKSYSEVSSKVPPQYNLEKYTNEYLWYIEDEDFKEIITKLILEYNEKSRINFNEKKFFENRLDIFKMIIDISLKNISIKEWVQKEVARQEDKSNTNVIGFFHEKLIGKIDGWTTHKVGEGIDITGKNATIELKNKHNTVKGEDEVGIFEKLEGKLQNYPNFKTAYFARIIDKKSQNSQWNGERKIKSSLTNENKNFYLNNENFRIEGNKIYRKFNNKDIHIISGDKLYEILTGDKLAFKKLIEALPKIFKNLGYAKNFNENGELEKYLIYKNFSLSEYLGYEKENYKNIECLENLMLKKTNFYIQTIDKNILFNIDDYQEHNLSASSPQNFIILLKEDKTIFAEEIQYRFKINQSVILITDGVNNDFLKLILKLSDNEQILFSVNISKDLLI